MLRAGLILAGMVWAGAAGAFDNDYPALFAAHDGDLIPVSPGLRRLELPGPVIIEERIAGDGRRMYTARDESGLGAAGCSFALVLDLVVLAGLCPDMLDQEARARLDAQARALARFVGANAFPAMDEAAIGPGLLRLVQARMAAYRGAGADTGAAAGAGAGDGRGSAADPLHCPLRGGADPALAEMARNLTRPGGRAAIRRVISMPRLPVMQPCE